MTYLERPSPPKGPPWAHNSVGASVHNALAGWWRLRRPERTVAAAGGLLESGWIEEGYAGPGQSASQRATLAQPTAKVPHKNRATATMASGTCGTRS